MTLLSLTAFAATHGASRQAAAKWKSRGALVFSGDLVDVKASDKRLRNAGLGRFKVAAGEGQPAPATATGNRRKIRPEVAAAVDEVVTDLRAAAEDGEIDDEIAGGFIEQLLEGKFRSKVQANAIKENALALKHLLSAQKDAGKLVDIETAESILFDDRRQARDAWEGWPTRIGPLLAADLGLETAVVVEALKPYVHQQLEELGEPDLDFTADGED
jgi:hypothetical protein